MATYQTLRASSRRFGKNGFIEVSRARLVENGETTDFLLVTRGFLDKDGTRQWTRFVTLPDEPAMKEWLAETLRTT